ncbi:MAG TPA: universal stress protein [Candidatus Acidoferrales bacterium]|nr:universal stress protein [Candidatus Acidoferrales bacterium]
MATAAAVARINLKNILFLTDFSEPSEAALPFAISIARAYGAKLHGFHVLLPTPSSYMTPDLTVTAIEAEEESAQANLQRLEAQLAGVQHESSVERGIGVWPSVERAIKDSQIDLVVLGTHGRTGARKLLLGSVAEEIFRRSAIPVLTIGPGVRTHAHNDARFRRVLFATDFSPHSLAAWPYAVSLAQENQARLVLLHVVPEKKISGEEMLGAIPKGSPLSRLNALLPKEAELWCRPEAVVEYGDAATRILEEANNRGADLIVLGVRDASGHIGAATHLGRTTAHKVVAHAPCPVLTVRG